MFVKMDKESHCYKILFLFSIKLELNLFLIYMDYYNMFLYFKNFVSYTNILRIYDRGFLFVKKVGFYSQEDKAYYERKIKKIHLFLIPLYLRKSFSS